MFTLVSTKLCEENSYFLTNKQIHKRTDIKQSYLYSLSARTQVLTLLKYSSSNLQGNKEPEIYIQSAPNNSNETYTFMCLDRAGRFGPY